MRGIERTVGLLLVMIAAALAVNSQEVQKTPTADPAAVDSRTTTPDYVFPTERERFKRYVMSTIGPMRLLRTGAAAGIQQWNDDPEEWGQGMKGYGRRFASAMGQTAIQQTVTYGLDEAMGLDTGFQRSEREGFFPRLKDALIQNVTSRTRNGKRVISVPRFAGAYAGGIISTETWYPDRYSYKDGLRNGTKSLLAGFGVNLLREFVIK
jgi:hypothetical protein